jgi:hypothetical protein
MATNQRLLDLLAEAKALAKEYYDLTNKPLGVTGEVAEFEAARLLNLELVEARQAGYDALEVVDGKEFKVQIKSRRFLPNSFPSQMVGSINTNDAWDTLLLVILNEHFNATGIWQVSREAILAALSIPGSRARSERNALSVGRIKQLGQKRWPLV